MSSEQEVNIVAPARISNKLTLDSDEEQRKEAEQRAYEEEIQRKKQQKRKRREEAERAEQQKIKLQQQKQKKYDAPEMMFQEDSQDGAQFRRVVKKITRMYPQHTNKFQVQSSKKKNDFIADDNEGSSSESDSGSNSDGSQQSSESKQKKVKKEKRIEKQKRPEKKVEKKPVEKKKVEAPLKKQKIKIEHKSDKKQSLVRQVSVRWWYALPEWPPADFDYQSKLKELGYRVLNAQKFKLEDDIINGYQKVVAVDGYNGVYKSRTKLIDVRPKQSAPTLNNFRNMSIQQLTSILRKALAVQIQQLKEVKYKQKGEDQLLNSLERELIRLR